MNFVTKTLHGTIEAIGARLYAPHDENAKRPEDADLGPRFFEYIADMPAGLRIGLHALVLLFGLFASLSVGKLARFTNLNEDEQDRVLAFFTTTRIGALRMALLSIRTMLSIVFYDDPDVSAETGWLLDGSDCVQVKS